MDFNAWERGRGDEQLRVVEPDGFEQSEDAAFVIGSDRAKVFEYLTTFDYGRVVRTADLTGKNYVRARIRFATRSTPNANDRWWAIWYVAGGFQTQGSMIILGASRIRETSDYACAVPGLTGSQQIGVMLFPFLTDSSPGNPVESELPVVYLDDFTLDDDGSAPALLNRSPSPDETGYPSTDVVGENHISFEIVDPNLNALDLSSLILTVDGVVAYSGGSPQNGWTVDYFLPGPTTGSLVNNILAASFGPPDDFESLATIPIRVQMTSNGGLDSMDETYSFTVEDLTPPEFASVQAIDQKVVRVTYDEPVRAEGDGAGSDALTPGNYTFEALNDTVTPAVPIAAASVERVSETEFDILLDWEMTPGVEYAISIENVEDLFGNAIGGGAISSSFVGYAPPTPWNRVWDYYRMLPRLNRDEDTSQDLLRFVRCLQEVGDLLLYDIDRWVDIFDLDRCPEIFLDAILADLGNPFAFDLTIAEKRKLARILVPIYKLKGTNIGVESVLRFFLDVTATVQEHYDGFGWRLGDSELGIDTWLGLDDRRSIYSFDVVVDRVLTDSERDLLRDIVDYMKPPHTHHIRTVEP